MKINLGCGQVYLDGYVNCDVLEHVRADRHFDLETIPYPFDSECADEILMDNVLEHLEDVPRVMEELYRVLKPGGVLRIIVPYAKTDWALQDPTHKHFFTEKSMAYFCGEGRYGYYTRARFRLLRAELKADTTNWMHRARNLLPFRNVLRYFLYNMYDTVHFDLERLPANPSSDTGVGRDPGSASRPCAD